MPLEFVYFPCPRLTIKSFNPSAHLILILNKYKILLTHRPASTTPTKTTIMYNTTTTNHVSYPHTYPNNLRRPNSHSTDPQSLSLANDTLRFHAEKALKLLMPLTCIKSQVVMISSSDPRLMRTSRLMESN